MSSPDQNAAKSPVSVLKRYKRLILVILALVLSQSFTFSLPIDGRIVDESGKPVANAQIAALWLLNGWNPVDSAPSAGAVRVSHVTSDAHGRFRVPAAFILHAPVIPFSMLLRSNEMPILVVTARGYGATLANNDRYGINGPSNRGGIWFVRTSSLRGSDIKLEALTDLVRRDNADTYSRLSLAENQIYEARDSCKHRITCSSTSVESVLDLIRQNSQSLQELSRKR